MSTQTDLIEIALDVLAVPAPYAWLHEDCLYRKANHFLLYSELKGLRKSAGNS